MTKMSIRWWAVVGALLLIPLVAPLWVTGWTCGLMFGILSDGYQRGRDTWS